MITAAKVEDAGACSNILHEWIAENPWFPSDAPESASEQSMQQRIENGQVFVAQFHDEINGFIAFANGYLDCLYLTPEARNRGMGVKLLEQAKAQNPLGLNLWVLAQNQGARRFYTREGFEEIAFGDGSDNEENLPDIKMEWQPEEALNDTPT